MRQQVVSVQCAAPGISVTLANVRAGASMAAYLVPLLHLPTLKTLCNCATRRSFCLGGQEMACAPGTVCNEFAPWCAPWALPDEPASAVLCGRRPAGSEAGGFCLLERCKWRV